VLHFGLGADTGINQSEAFAYRFGNCSVLEWVIDQYQVTTDKRSGITSDPNREDEPRYIVDTATQPIAWAQAIFEVSPPIPPHKQRFTKKRVSRSARKHTKAGRSCARSERQKIRGNRAQRCQKGRDTNTTRNP